MVDLLNHKIIWACNFVLFLRQALYIERVLLFRASMRNSAVIGRRALNMTYNVTPYARKLN